MTDSQFIRSLRKALKITQAQLAEMIEVSAPAISRWETGDRKVSKPVMMLLRQKMPPKVGSAK